MVFLAIFLLSAGIILSALYHRANHTVEQSMNTFHYYLSPSVNVQLLLISFKQSTFEYPVLC